MLNFIGLAILLIVAILLLLACRHAWHSENRLWKWAGSAVAALLAAVAAMAAVIAMAGLHKLEARDAPVPILQVAGTPDQITRGRAVAESFCDDCHSRGGALTGGFDIGKELSVDIGHLVTANLTPAGELDRWSDGQIFRAIRNSVDADGHWLVIMSYTGAGNLSDEDIEALIAYIRTVPPAGVETPDPPDQLNMLGVTMLGAGLLPSGRPIQTGAIAAPPKAATAAYGGYILSYQDCRGCHGPNLTGGVQGQLGPIGPDLDLVKDWTLEQFMATMRTGIDPAGHQISGEMPWRPIGKMDDVELGAIYQYLVDMPNS